jgi:hypothetical protein
MNDGWPGSGSEPCLRGELVKGILASLCISVIVVGCLTGCSGGGEWPPPTLPTIPAYPNSQQAHVAAESGSYKSAERTTFRSNDKPATVLTFYRDALLKEEWEKGKEGLGKGDTYILMVGCQLSILDIVAKPDNSGQTVVNLELTSQYCD